MYQITGLFTVKTKARLLRCSRSAALIFLKERVLSFISRERACLFRSLVSETFISRRLLELWCQTSLPAHLGESGATHLGISCFHSCITRWKAVINFKSLCCSTHFCLQTRLIRQQELSAEMVSYCSGLNESMSRQRRHKERQRDVASPVLPGSLFSPRSQLGVLDESLDGNGPPFLPHERGRPRRRRKRRRNGWNVGPCCRARHQIYLYEKLSIFFFFFFD